MDNKKKSKKIFKSMITGSIIKLFIKTVHPSIDHVLCVLQINYIFLL